MSPYITLHLPERSRYRSIQVLTTSFLENFPVCEVAETFTCNFTGENSIAIRNRQYRKLILSLHNYGLDSCEENIQIKVNRYPGASWWGIPTSNYRFWINWNTELGQALLWRHEQLSPRPERRFIRDPHTPEPPF